MWFTHWNDPPKIIVAHTAFVLKCNLPINSNAHETCCGYCFWKRKKKLNTCNNLYYNISSDIQSINQRWGYVLVSSARHDVTCRNALAVPRQMSTCPVNQLVCNNMSGEYYQRNAPSLSPLRPPTRVTSVTCHITFKRNNYPALVTLLSDSIPGSRIVKSPPHPSFICFFPTHLLSRGALRLSFNDFPK